SIEKEVPSTFFSIPTSPSSSSSSSFRISWSSETQKRRLGALRETQRRGGKGEGRWEMGTVAQAEREIMQPLLEPAVGSGSAGAAARAEGGLKVPHWREQITVRGLVVSALLGALFCIISHKLNLTSGVIPGFNVAAGLLGFFFVKSWTEFLSKLGIFTFPFTPQENTVIQTCVVACYGISASGNWPSVDVLCVDFACASGGFGSYILSMDQRTYELIGADYPGNRAEDVKNPTLGWMIGFTFVVSFLGLFSLVPLRKAMIIDYKLTYPSGTATALLINSFHTNTGSELAGFYFDFSPTYVGCGLICPPIVNCSAFLGAIISWGFLWPFIKTHAGDWYPAGLDSNDFKGLYGYKVPNLTPLYLWARFKNKGIGAGSASQKPIGIDRSGPILAEPVGFVECSDHVLASSDVQMVFIAISLILGDGLYNLIKIVAITVKTMCNAQTKCSSLPLVNTSEGKWLFSCRQDRMLVMYFFQKTVAIFFFIIALIILFGYFAVLSYKIVSYLNALYRGELAQGNYCGDETSELLEEEKLRNKTFVKDSISSWFAASAYVALAAISTATVPMIFPQVRWYLVLVSYMVAPALAFSNSYGSGLTDCSLSATYGKIGLFIFASVVGSNGGVIAGLAACGVMMSIVVTAADLMQDFKTGYLTLSSPRSMFVSQLIGTAMGCVIAPLTFWIYWSAFDIGSPDGAYKAPNGVIYREMAILGVEGFSALPKHCLAICCGFFIAALVINLARDVTPENISQYIPIPMAMAVPFYIGAYFAIDMFVGTVILFVWERIDRRDAEDCAGAMASGLICGDGIWTVPSAILSIFKIDPPICMSFGLLEMPELEGKAKEEPC
ncbi:hypothetical protein Taro_013100, partial [Colocasia esculenta]|nr:hypothetical protein [Colocasia esculenta]